MKLNKPAIEYSGTERVEIYSRFLKEERRNINPSPVGITGAQMAAAKGRATKKFFSLGF